jgi:hypothetical protein
MAIINKSLLLLLNAVLFLSSYAYAGEEQEKLAKGCASSGGDPYSFAVCFSGALTSAEIAKISTGDFYGKNNTLRVIWEKYLT